MCLVVRLHKCFGQQIRTCVTRIFLHQSLIHFTEYREWHGELLLPDELAALACPLFQGDQEAEGLLGPVKPGIPEPTVSALRMDAMLSTRSGRFGAMEQRSTIHGLIPSWSNP